MSDLPLVCPPQPRRVNGNGKYGEADGIYLTVLALRKAGFRVHRSGALFHKVNGRIFNDRELKRFLEEQPDGREDH